MPREKWFPMATIAAGDDRLQEQAGGTIDQDTWTHGSSEQRQRWFKRGFDSSDPDSCDTFSGGIQIPRHAAVATPPGQRKAA